MVLLHQTSRFGHTSTRGSDERHHNDTHTHSGCDRVISLGTDASRLHCSRDGCPRHCRSKHTTNKHPTGSQFGSSPPSRTVRLSVTHRMRMRRQQWVPCIFLKDTTNMANVIHEFIGTFTLLSVGLRTQNPIILSMTLLVIMGIGGSLLLNPAISTMLFARGMLSPAMLLGCVTAQFSAGIVALLVYQVIGA